MYFQILCLQDGVIDSGSGSRILEWSEKMGLVAFCCRYRMSWCSRSWWLTKLEARNSWGSLVLSGKGLSQSYLPRQVQDSRGHQGSPSRRHWTPQEWGQDEAGKDMGPQVGQAGQGCGELETDPSAALLWLWG